MTVSETLVDRVLAVLPQTQCTRCGYPDCAAYAHAIADGQEDINRCPPGGAEGVARLARVTGRAILPLNPANGTEGPRTLAFINEAWCIGCTLCIKACPTDAIVGSNKRMHTVIEAHCTGCELCVPVCPVDCIELALAHPVTTPPTGWAAWSQPLADHARDRYKLRRARDAREDARAPAPPVAQTQGAGSDAKKPSVIEAALAKARAQRAK